jgi:hypothetical protein
MDISHGHNEIILFNFIEILFPEFISYLIISMSNSAARNRNSLNAEEFALELMTRFRIEKEKLELITKFI